jgi:hypothetical protein
MNQTQMENAPEGKPLTLSLADILNKRFALRQLLTNAELREKTTSIHKNYLTPEQEPLLRAILAQLATQILADPASILQEQYELAERKKDWLTLAKKPVLEADGSTLLALDTRSRPGHKILDQHMPHFYEVKNYKGKSVRGLFTQEILEKALLANLSMHSTPYKSEIRRMITMTGGLGNVTKYRAVTSKAIIQFYGSERILDPCAGWGGRMLGCLAAGPNCAYVGCEPDPQTAQGLRNILADPAIPAAVRARAQVFEKPAEVALAQTHSDSDLGLFDMVLTSPPYFNLELYTAGQQSTNTYPTWEGWTEQWLKPVILGCLAHLKPGGVSCWSVKNFKTDKKYPLADVTKKIHQEAGWHLVQTVKMTGSARPGGKRIDEDTGKEKRGSEEETFCFKKL